MAGELDQVIPGEVIESAWGNAVGDRILNRYADATDRDTKNPTPSAGDLAYLQNVDHMQMYNGTAWVGVINTRQGPTIEAGQTLGFDDGITTGAGTIGNLGGSQLTAQYATNMAWLLNSTQAYFHQPGFGGGTRLGLDLTNGAHLGRMWAGPMYSDNDWGFWTETNPLSVPSNQPWASGYNTGYGMLGTQGSFAQYLTYNWYRHNGGYTHINQGGNAGASMIKMLGDRITFGVDNAYAATGEPGSPASGGTRATCYIDATGYGTANGTSSASIRTIFLANSTSPSGGAEGDVWLSFGSTKGVWFKIGGVWQLCAN